MAGDFDTIIADIQALRRRGLGGERAAHARAQAMVTAALVSAEDADRARVLHEHGRLRRDLGQATEAIAAYGEAAGIWRSLGDADGLAHALRHRADMLVEDGDAATARPLIEEALGLLDGADALTRANAARVLALCHEALGLPARDAWQEAQTLYQQAGIDAGVEACARHLA